LGENVTTPSAKERPLIQAIALQRSFVLCTPHVRDDVEHLQFEVLDHGVAPIW